MLRMPFILALLTALALPVVGYAQTSSPTMKAIQARKAMLIGYPKDAFPMAFAGDDGNAKDCYPCGSHTLHFPHYAATLPPL